MLTFRCATAYLTRPLYKKFGKCLFRARRSAPRQPGNRLVARSVHLTGIKAMDEKKDPKDISEKEWREKLTPDQFYICRQRGTEPAYRGRWVNHKAKGTYTCIACGADLFSSEHKFVSNCGWPSFYMALGTENGDESQASIRRKEDSSFGMVRTEVLCRQCNSHLGHVFNDGPLPTRIRFCINSIALNFRPAPKEPLH